MMEIRELELYVVIVYCGSIVILVIVTVILVILLIETVNLN